MKSHSVQFRSAVSALTIIALIATSLTLIRPPASSSAESQRFPWQAPGSVSTDGLAPVGVGFNLDIGDLRFILKQIKVSEAHAAISSPDDPNCQGLRGPGEYQLPLGDGGELLPWGVRTITGVCNNLVPGREYFGASGQEFPRLTGAPIYPEAELVSFDLNGGMNFPGPGYQTTYAPPFDYWVDDSQPRFISNLIVDQTSSNPAAVAIAAGIGAIEGDIDGSGVLGDHPVENYCGMGMPPFLCHFYNEDAYYFPNVATDEGLSAPFNSLLTFFGQFFDHGLDFTTKNGETIYMPLQPDDPLYNPATPHTNFMVLTRSSVEGDPAINKTTPFVDQQQTYGSSPSVHVFLRQYSDADGRAVSTGKLNIGAAGGMQTWAALKEQALIYLGLRLSDHEALDAPVILTDLYGNFIPGDDRGMPQIKLSDGSTLEGDRSNPLNTWQAERSGSDFLADISHFAVPGMVGPNCTMLGEGELKMPDTDVIVNPMIPTAELAGGCYYDDENLGAHYIAGDGRVNENIALTSVHHVFHSEHNRLVDHVKAQVTDLNNGELLAEFQLADGSWNGSRLFQAAKFVTEMEYQHLAFEEFARKIQPLINPFTGYDASVNAAINAEFAHATYRFGHSMLVETVDRYDVTFGTSDHTSLFEVFLNPTEFDQGGTLDHEAAAGGIIAGSVAQIGQEIDEFVTPALRNQLLGVPLDLAAINIARGRDAGIPSLNVTRERLWNANNNDPSLKPYDSWRDYQNNLRNQESLVNLVAAYGTHESLDGLTTVDDARVAADLLVNGGMNAPADADDFMWSSGEWADKETGLNNVDLWMGGLAERPEIFGGLLGTTHNSVFEVQMERLQNGDRFYYLHRLLGTNLLASLEGNSFAELIERNTKVTQLPADVFSHPSFRFNLNVVNPHDAMPLVNDPSTEWDETMELLKTPAGKVWYQGADHVLFYGREIADNIQSGDGDDTVKGNGGNDVLEGEGGNDVLVGGEGNDILTDTFGDDDLKGGPGSDTLHGGAGLDLLQGGYGDDAIFIGSDASEIFGGPGQDLLGGGADADVIFGDEGDDWIEAGGGSDAIAGDNAAPFFNNPNGTDGHDVIDGGGGNDDIDAEGGDDIMKAGEGTERFEGLLGWDWVTYVNSPQAADADLLRTGFAPIAIDTNGDRFDMVEGLSGGSFDDKIRGDHRGTGIGGGELLDPLACELLVICGDLIGHELTAEGIVRFDGVADILNGATSYDSGNILLGGAGNDIIEGRGGNDIIDGDRHLEVKLRSINPNGLLGSTMEVDSISELSGYLVSGELFAEDITIVRRVTLPPAAVAPYVDTAVFGSPMDQYNITDFGDYIVVDHVRGCGDPLGVCDEALADPVTGALPTDDGRDVLFGIEVLEFNGVELLTADMGLRGMLRVTTDNGTGGGLPAQISVNSVPMDSWGLSWVELSPGTREVCFSDLEGYTTPACVPALMQDGVTTEVVGTYTQRGFLHVTTTGLFDSDPNDTMPATENAIPATIIVDGIPMDDWGVWTDIDTGAHEVCFGAVAGYTAPFADTEDPAGPGCQTVVVNAGDTTELAGQYQWDGTTAGPVGHGYLRVTASPAVATQISVDGEIRDTWSLEWLKITPGVHEVCFSDVTGFTTPDCQTVSVQSGITTTVNGNFAARGWLQVNTAPAEPSTISLNGVPRNAWGMWTHLEPGAYEVCFTETMSHNPPACEQLTVTAGQLTTHTGVLIAKIA